MRANRISDILFASFLASAAALAAAPASAQSPYDGLWQVTVVTKTGSCDAQTTSTVNVADGKISPSNGVIYVQVADIQASCRKSQELGGTVVPGFPFNLADGIGAIALVLDPSGHPMGMYSRTPLPSAVPPTK